MEVVKRHLVVLYNISVQSPLCFRAELVRDTPQSKTLPSMSSYGTYFENLSNLDIYLPVTICLSMTVKRVLSCSSRTLIPIQGIDACL
jgi:hypothetical protein